jgi:7-keto-8-aminopelargonate synthetase-like enzyme
MRISPAAARVNSVFEDIESSQACQLVLDANQESGRFLHYQGQRLLHFGNCSYLGLDLEPTIREAARSAIDLYGMNNSMSRTFAHIPLFEQTEAAFTENFGQPAVVTLSTTYVHLSAMPVFIAPDDAIVVDFQAHASLQMAVTLMKGYGCRVETVGHNAWKALRQRVARLSKTHEHIWYVADGVYSMFGDTIDIAAVDALMDEFPGLHLYVDDAHGAGWTGHNGSGVALDQLRHRHRTLLAFSLSKVYGCGLGGILICPNETSASQFRRTGASLIFMNPPPASMLAPALLAAQLMRTPELQQRRARLDALIRYFIAASEQRALALVDKSHTPIFFLRLGLPGDALRMGHQLLQRGFYANPVGYPAVPMRSAGLRITLTTHLHEADIDQLLDTVLALQAD